MFRAFLFSTLLILLSACDNRVATPGYESSYTPGAGHSSTIAIDGPRYMPGMGGVSTTTHEDEEREEINQAKREVIEAQQALSDAWRMLDGSDWSETLGIVADRLRDLEEANDQLSSLDTYAASEMEWEISRMKGEMDRLYLENWRYVVPDLDANTRNLENASSDMEASIEDDE